MKLREGHHNSSQLIKESRGASVSELFPDYSGLVVRIHSGHQRDSMRPVFRMSRLYLKTHMIQDRYQWPTPIPVPVSTR